VQRPSRPDTLHAVVLKAAVSIEIKRREFIAATAALLVSTRHVHAQGKPRRIGY
jgi:hypothetical protein